MNSQFKLLCAVITGLTLTGCSLLSTNPKQLPLGKTFHIESIDNRQPIMGSFTTLSFEKDNRAYGLASCNSFMAHYQVSDHSLLISSIGTTRKQCSAALMRQENEFIAALESAKFWTYDASTKKLIITYGKQQELVLTLSQ
ncbi:META domain-containing protein [Pseudomonas sp. F1_0610]|uniref:META domain-containing protein n=1 Tax=Pseudomonas sp. F1_0610 TaxID=3114284 RepID=UPI0039C1B92A